ncbi:MAG TPA: type II toxin-antitoxin system Phd/YefM family antitoxin [bacterium]|nr:type II toxin-antitoxin system Phd/YefM family antitoxin [bacterium]
MKTVEAAEAKSSLGEYAKKAKNEPVIVTARGKPVAVLVSIHNADLETVSMSNNPGFLALIERSRTRHITEGGISTEEMRRRLKKT